MYISHSQNDQLTFLTDHPNFKVILQHFFSAYKKTGIARIIYYTGKIVRALRFYLLAYEYRNACLTCRVDVSDLSR